MAKKVADGDTANQCPTASADMPPSTSGLVEALGQAIALLRDDRLDEAEAAFIRILERWPGQPDALHFQGVLRHSQGRLDEAVELISAALRQIPEHADAWNNLGNVLLVAGRVDDAVQAYERGIAIAAGQPETAAALSNLSIVHRRQGRAAEAESACRRALDVAPDFADAWYNLSLVLMERGEVHEGLLANSRAIALWPQRAQPRDQVIRALLLLGERERAAGLYREWLAEEPDNPVIHHQLAACLGNAVPVRASDAYVQQVFDSFADSFDAKLESLHYRAPELIAQALAEAAGEPVARSTSSTPAAAPACAVCWCGPGRGTWRVATSRWACCAVPCRDRCTTCCTRPNSCTTWRHSPGISTPSCAPTPCVISVPSKRQSRRRDVRCVRAAGWCSPWRPCRKTTPRGTGCR